MTEAEKHSFYHRQAWLQKREAILRRDHWECQECRRRLKKASAEGVRLVGADRELRRATLVHHIKHLEDHPELGLDDDNLEAVCETCHNVLHGRTPEAWGTKKAKRRATVERW